MLKDCLFNEKAKLEKFKESVITFMPELGSMNLMNYRITDKIDFPLLITPFL